MKNSIENLNKMNGTVRYYGNLKMEYWNNLCRLRSLLKPQVLIIEQGKLIGENRVFWRGKVVGHENYQFETFSMNRKFIEIYKEQEKH